MGKLADYIKELRSENKALKDQLDLSMRTLAAAGKTRQGYVFDGTDFDEIDDALGLVPQAGVEKQPKQSLVAPGGGVPLPDVTLPNA